MIGNLHRKKKKKKGRGGDREECPALRQVEEMESVKLCLEVHAEESKIRPEMLVRIRLSKNLNVKLKCTDLTTLATESHHSFLRGGQCDHHLPIGRVLRGRGVGGTTAVIHARGENTD